MLVSVGDFKEGMIRIGRNGIKYVESQFGYPPARQSKQQTRDYEVSVYKD